MTKLERYIRKNYDVAEAHLPKLVGNVQALIDSGDYNDEVYGKVSESTVCDLIDQEMESLA